MRSGNVAKVELNVICRDGKITLKCNFFCQIDQWFSPLTGLYYPVTGVWLGIGGGTSNVSPSIINGLFVHIVVPHSYIV